MRGTRARSVAAASAVLALGWAAACTSFSSTSTPDTSDASVGTDAPSGDDARPTDSGGSDAGGRGCDAGAPADHCPKADGTATGDLLYVVAANTKGVIFVNESDCRRYTCPTVAYEKDAAAYDCLASPKPNDELRACSLSISSCEAGATFSVGVGVNGQCVDSPCSYTCTFP
ncbi:MAG TPA: hypothetical protein VIF62_10155 [Labilithrix sp.]|jgi:hypothetical protein